MKSEPEFDEANRRDRERRRLARLAAAAPDLLDALKRTLSWLTSYPGDGCMGPDGPYEQARAAITKAEEQ